MKFKSAFIAFVGRPNSGKSTLLNAIIDENLSIVTPLPQTTQKLTRGIYTCDRYQLIFIDTPGIHQGKHKLNQLMYRQSLAIFKDKGVDIICYIVDLTRPPGKEEKIIADMVAKLNTKVFIIFNKTDVCPTVEQTMGLFFQQYPALKKHNYLALCALSPLTKELFLTSLEPMIPYGPQYYPDDLYTDANLRFMAAEVIRKWIIQLTFDEVPHAVYIDIVNYRESEKRHQITVDIHVETQGQKGIIIGKKGQLINRIKEYAQKDISAYTGVNTKLTCHVKVSPSWRDNKKFLDEKGWIL